MKENIRTGIDIVDISRIKKILKKSEKSFLNRIFTELEIGYIEDKGTRASTVAGIFAAKEAVSKVLGSGIGKISWKDIEINHKKSGKPYVDSNDKLREKLEYLKIGDIDISISHEREYAIALAIGIGSSKLLEKSMGADLKIEIPDEFKKILSKRKDNTHKGSYGRVALIAGSRGMTGAPYLASQAALRSGSGLIYSLVPRSIEEIMGIKLTEAIVRPIEDNGRGHFTRSSLSEILGQVEGMDALGIGPGMGVGKDRLNILEELIKTFKNPIVLDADAINCLSIKPDLLYNRSGQVVITPHPAELGRFLGKTTDEIQENREFHCRYASDKYNIIVVLKGSKTLVAYPGEKEIYTNSTGNPGMATAGSGDVLTGMILSFLGQKAAPLDAAKLGVFIHGLAGDFASLDKGEYSMIASDIIDNISKAIRAFEI